MPSLYKFWAVSNTACTFGLVVPWLHKEFKASQGYIRPWVKKEKEKKNLKIKTT